MEKQSILQTVTEIESKPNIAATENISKPQNTVRFEESNEYFSTDSSEGIHSDDDISRTGKSVTNNVSKTSSAIGIGGEGGDMQSASSISTSILDDVEEVKVLKKKINELEAKNKLLDFEIEKVNLCLINERTKTTKLEKKLQFVKDNQDVFIKLKEAYINMKYNEAAGRKMVEIREKGLQTWEGILCRGCIDAEQLRRQIESFQQTYKDSFIITPFQLEQLLSTVRYLKDLIERRETTWSEIAERDEKIQTKLHHLEYENNTLRELLQYREKRDLLGENCNSDEALNTELTIYKKIIIKYEKKLRDLEKCSHGIIKCNIPFNEKEKKIVNYLMVKYLSRLTDKNEKRSSRSLSRVAQRHKAIRGHCVKTRSEKRSPAKNIHHQQSAIDLPLPNQGDRGEMGDTTLKLMNYVLEGKEEGDNQTNGGTISM